MSAISSKIMIQAIEDGSSIHGTLLTTNPLAQAYSYAGTVQPNWETDTSKRPTVYLSLLKGTTQIASTISSWSWYLNGTLLTFDSTTHLSTNTGYEGVFLDTTYNGAPALTICKNLASATNQDNDTITFSATYTSDGASVPFELNVDVRIGVISANGYFGVIDTAILKNSTFIEGGGTVLKKGEIDNVYLYAILYDANGEVTYPKNGGGFNYYADFHIGPEEVNEHGSPADSRYVEDAVIYPYEGAASSAAKHYPLLALSTEDILDYAIIECDFYGTYNNGYQDYLCMDSVEVDDQGDPEMMYISSAHISNPGTPSEVISESGEGNVTYLRDGEGVQYKFWVGTQTETMKSNPDSRFNYFYVCFLDVYNDEYLSPLSDEALTLVSSTPTEADYGYRKAYTHQVTKKLDGTPVVSTPSGELHFGMFNVVFGDVRAMGSKVTGFLAACTAKVEHDT